MPRYLIAGLITEYAPRFGLLEKRSERFLTDADGEPDIKIDIPLAFFEQKQREHPTLTVDECEYLYVGGEFYRLIVEHGGCLLHSSTVVMDGKAYMFSAPPGVGKSTHTSLWLKEFGGRAHILNDDKPAIRGFDGVFYACGTPFSGKSDLSVNEKVPVGAICFIERAKENTIERLGAKEILFRFFSQTHRPTDREGMEKLIVILNELCSKIPFYRLNCNTDPEAARLAHRVMSESK